MICIMGGDEYTFAEDRVLYRMVTEPQYRASLVGDRAASSDWDLIGMHLKKTAGSAQKRFLELKDAAGLADDRSESDIDIGSLEDLLKDRERHANQEAADAVPTGQQPHRTQPHRTQPHGMQPPLQSCSAPEPAMGVVGSTIQAEGMASGADTAGVDGLGADTAGVDGLGADTQAATTAGTKRKAPKIRSGSTKSNQKVRSGAKTGKYWTDAETIHLLQLGRDEKYREKITGSRTMDWAAIGLSLGRGARAAKRKFDNLQCVEIAPRPDGKGFMLVRPENEGKKWSDEEVIELLQLVDPTNALYRQEKLGAPDVDWKSIARHFRRSRDAVAYKFQYETASFQPGKNEIRPGPDGEGFGGDPNVGSGDNVDGTNGPEVGTSKARKRHPLAPSYQSMAISALYNVQPQSLEATSRQICAYIESNPEYAPLLDRSIMPGKKSVPRWKQGIRSALYAYSYFINTDRKDGSDIIWRLDLEVLESTNRQRQERRMIASINRAAKEERRKSKLARDVATAYNKVLAINEAVMNKKLRIAHMASQQVTRLRDGNGDSDGESDGESDGDTGNDSDHGVRAPDNTASGATIPLRGAGLEAEANHTSAPITLQQILEQSITAAQLAQLSSPGLLADLQNQLDVGLHHPFQPCMGYFEKDMVSQGNYCANLQPQKTTHVGMYPPGPQYQPYGVPPYGGRAPPQSELDSESE